MKRRRPAFTALADACRVEAAGTVALDTGSRPATRPNGWGVGIARLAPFDWAPPVDIWSREAAMSVPSISRARDLICTAVGGLPIQLWTYRWDDPSRQVVEQQTPPARWMLRPDPNRTRQWILSWTVDDLLFHGRAYWRITSRLATSFPATFQLMPFVDVSISADGAVSFNRQPVDPADVVEFCSPIEGLLSVGYRAINTALNLDAAAERFSLTEIPAGWLEQTDNSEPMSGDELTGIAEDFAAARQARTVAALNPFIRWRESTMDPTRLQLVEARQHQAVEMARLCNIPAYFLNAPIGTGMTYMNAAQAKQDLIDFAALPYVQAVEQTLAGPNVTPHGQTVRLDVNAWLRSPFNPGAPSPNDMQIAYNTPPQAQPQPPATPGRPRQVDGLNEGTPQP